MTVKNYTEMSMWALKDMRDSFQCASMGELKHIWERAQGASYKDMRDNKLINDNFVSQRFIDVVDMSTKMLFDIWEGNATHVFMPDMDFCEWAVKYGPKPKYFEMYINNNLLRELGTKNYVIHFPTGVGAESFAFKIIDGKEDGKKELLIRTAKAFETFPDRIDEANESRRHKEEIIEKVDWYGKLVLGLSMYVECFPDHFSDGLPKCLAMKKRFKKLRSVTVSLSHEMFPGGKVRIGRGVSPHMRAGHNRYLGHPCFKHMQGETISVKPAGIKIRDAKTVVDIPEGENHD